MAGADDAGELSRRLASTLAELCALGQGGALAALRLSAMLEILCARPDAAQERRVVDQVRQALEAADRQVADARRPAHAPGDLGQPGVVVRFPVERVAGIERMISKGQLADVLGVSVSWVDRAMARRGLPSTLVGGMRRFRFSEVYAWLEKCQ